MFYDEVFVVTGDDWITTYKQIEHNVSAAILAIVARTMVILIIVEGLRIVIAEVFQKRRRARDRAEGEAAANMRWAAWLKRKEEAEQAGKPFHEPPPFEISENDA